MRVFIKGLFCALLATSLYTGAQAGDDDFHTMSGNPFKDPNPNMITVGAGVGYNNSVDVLIQAQVMYKNQVKSDGNPVPNLYFIIARVNNLDALAGKDGVPYLDINVDSVGGQWGIGDIFGSFSLLNLDVQRNVMVDDNFSVRLSLVGIRGQYATEIADSIRFIGKAAVDLVGYGYSQRKSDKSSTNGWTAGAALEGGLEIHENLRVALGEKVSTIWSKAKDQPALGCVSENGSKMNCDTFLITDYSRAIVNSETYLSIVYSIAETFSIFGYAGLDVYSMSDKYGEVASTLTAAGQLRLGISYKF